MSVIERYWERPEYQALRDRIETPWNHPYPEGDEIIYSVVDDNLKADIAVELMPWGIVQNYRPTSIYRGSNFGHSLHGSSRQLKK